jgi:hypothetical protein
MGTRNCIMVVLDGEYKVAKYNQWDGYPTGVGKDIIKFIIQDMDLNKFKEEVKKLTYCTPKDVEHSYELLNISLKDGFISMEDSDLFNAEFPYLGRDMSADLLKSIQEGKVPFTLNDLEFVEDSLFCEWAYVMNLDTESLEIYEGFNRKPVPEGERFTSFNKVATNPKWNGYYPVYHKDTISFDVLKGMAEGQILASLQKMENEEED